MEQRFVLLREIIACYRIRLQKMEQEVVKLFAENQLSAISACMREKQRLVRRIARLEQFVQKYEAVNDTGITHDAKRQHSATE